MEKILWVQFTAEARQRQLASSPDFITTFRKGPKWLRPDLVGQRVQLVNCHKFHYPPCDENCEVFAEGTVVNVSYQKFKNISEVDHSRQSSDMTPEHRLEVMKAVYGEYDENTQTTVVTSGEVSVVPAF